MKEQAYAGFRIRLYAALLDTVIIVVPLMIVSTWIYGAEYWTGDRLYHGYWDLFLNYGLPFIVTTGCWLLFAGTPGKRLLKLKVVDEATGGKLSFRQSIIRYLGYFPAMIPLGMGFLAIRSDEKCRGWHDRWAGSVVVREGRSDDGRLTA